MRTGTENRVCLHFFVAKHTLHPFIGIKVFKGCFANQTLFVHSNHLVMSGFVAGIHTRAEKALAALQNRSDGDIDHWIFL